ncbi:MAG: hypothetical protein KDJ33_14995 [Gammaproteobacteria bacterium]|nr:hypothetical protein [Gammaproteobacteria bacterium]
MNRIDITRTSGFLSLVAALIVGLMSQIGAVAAERAVPVTVVNSEVSPVPVQAMGMVGIPYQDRQILVIPAGDAGGNVSFLAPAPDSLLVVEYLTLTIDSRDEQQGYLMLETQLDGEAIAHNLGPLPPLVLTGLGSGTSQFLQRNLTAYSDGPPRLLFTRGTGLDGERAILQATIVGRLVPNPAP